MKLLIKILGNLWLFAPRYYWSRFKRFFFERKYKKYAPLPKVKNIPEIRSVLSQIRYKADNMWNLFDCISYPETTYALNRDDCDGYATIAIHLLKSIGIKGYYYTYIPSDWKKAHTVCLFKHEGNIFRFDNKTLIRSLVTDYQEYKKVRFPMALVEDLRDINFKKVKDI